VLKLCSKCKLEKPAEELFSKAKNLKDGYKCWCKECDKEWGKEYHLKNKDKIRKTHQEYREKNKDRLKERDHAYNKRNRGRAHAYYIKNKEKALDLHYQRKYGLTLKEASKIKAKGCNCCGIIEGILCIDHDHNTGKTRGCLCSRCNKALGFLNDSPSTVLKLYDYISSYQVSL